MIAELFGDAMMITGFVVVMMLLIEFLNVCTRGRWKQMLKQSGARQLVMAVLLGMLPGCLGGFAVVSLFTHGMLSFGAMVACMIATFGDEAFFLYALDPVNGLLLTVVLVVLAVAAGLLVQWLVKDFPVPFSEAHFSLHEADLHEDIPSGCLYDNLRHLSWRRAVLLSGVIVFACVLLRDAWTGVADVRSMFHAMLQEERGLNMLFALCCLASCWIVCKVPDHFLEEHLWKHIIREHFPRIFIWTLAVVTAVSLLDRAVDLPAWVRQHPLPMLGMALIIGLIPQSGPHLVFITLFVNGSIPFSVLLANSVVQEGHAGLPLMAESRRGFLWMKAISLILGLFVGLLGYFVDF